MKKNGLIHAMLKRSYSIERSPIEQKKSMNTQIAGLQFMNNELEFIKEGILANAYHKNESIFSFCENKILSTAAEILESGQYKIETDSGVFTLSKTALIKEIEFTQKIITTLLGRQAAISRMANLTEDEKLAIIKGIIKEDKHAYTQPGMFAKDDVKSLARGRYLIAAHMAKAHAFDASFTQNKGLNRFVHLFFTNTKKFQALNVKDSNVISEYVGVLSK